MSCVIAAPASDNGKTTLALLISCWALSKGLKLQTFKVGPDYLDQQQLSSIGHPVCRNLDIFLSGEDWIKKTFEKYSIESDLTLIEGAMGLFDGLGSTQHASTANIANVLNLPIIFIVDAKGQVASLLALIKGFRELNKNLDFKGLVFNNVNSERHKSLIIEVFKNEGIKIIGFMPSDRKITLRKSNLGLVSPNELAEKLDINYFASFAEKNLDITFLINSLTSKRKKLTLLTKELPFKVNKEIPIAIADDRIFHFQYPDTKEFLNEIGIPTISWNIFNDDEIPKEAKAIIIPGGFPERYSEHISTSKKSLKSLREFQKKGLIYAECGGMMILGESIRDEKGDPHNMAGILPFKSKRGHLTVGYRYIKGVKDSLIIKENELTRGHEFHYWQIEPSNNLLNNIQNDFLNKANNPWEIKSWGNNYQDEGWSTNNIHASWVHIHFPSNEKVLGNFITTLQKHI